MSIIVAIILGMLSLTFVLYPLFHRTSTNTQVVPLHGTSTDEVTASTEQEQGARTALQEVELDYQLGNISEVDYRILRERYLQRALVALKSRYDREQEIDEEIEEQLRKMKDSDETKDM